MEPPADLAHDSADLAHDSAVQHHATPAPWNFTSDAAINHTVHVQFSLTNGWASAIHAAQFLAGCSRLLLVEDDLLMSGIGFTSSVWVSAFLLAMRARRVLIEVPHNSSWPPKLTPSGAPHALASEDARWCSQPPYTLQCFLAPWTHCAATVRTSVAPWPTQNWPLKRGFNRTTAPTRRPNWRTLKRLPEQPAVLRMKLSWVKAMSDSGHLHAYLSSILNGNTTPAGPGADGAAQRFLFRPRAWIKARAACVMEEHGFEPRRFISVFYRRSTQKDRELATHRHGTPSTQQLAGIVAVVARRLSEHAAQTEAEDGAEAAVEAAAPHGHTRGGLAWRRVHLQSSAPVGDFVAELGKAYPAAKVGFTMNDRSAADTWGGWNHSASLTTLSTVAFVNQHICSQAAVLVSTPSSMWTWYLLPLLGEADEQTWRAKTADRSPQGGTEQDQAQQNPAPLAWKACCRCLGADRYLREAGSREADGGMANVGVWVIRSALPFAVDRIQTSDLRGDHTGRGGSRDSCARVVEMPVANATRHTGVPRPSTECATTLQHQQHDRVATTASSQIGGVSTKYREKIGTAF